MTLQQEVSVQSSQHIDLSRKLVYKFEHYLPVVLLIAYSAVGCCVVCLLVDCMRVDSEPHADRDHVILETRSCNPED